MAYDDIPEKLVFHECKIVYRNLAGRIDEYNERGDRSFAVVIDDPELADQLEEDGWRIKRRPPRIEGNPDFVTLKVFVKYENRPPKIYLVCGGVRTLLSESTVGEIDAAEILNVKLACVPYRGKNSRDGKFSAYCKTMYVYAEGDEFEDDFVDEYNDEVPFDE